MATAKIPFFSNAPHQGVDDLRLLKDQVRRMHRNHRPRSRRNVPPPPARPFQKVGDPRQKSRPRIVGMVDGQPVFRGLRGQNGPGRVQIAHVDVEQHPPQVFRQRAVVGGKLRIEFEQPLFARAG